MEREDYLTSLRGFAAIAVLLVHMHYLSPPIWAISSGIQSYIDFGVLGVPLFYLLSAYTLCLSATRRKGDGLFAFYLRRFFRIAPLFYVMTAVYLFWIGNQPELAITANVLFLFNFIPEKSIYEGIVWASWSIGVEVLFYTLLTR